MLYTQGLYTHRHARQLSLRGLKIESALTGFPTLYMEENTKSRLLQQRIPRDSTNSNTDGGHAKW